MKKITLLSVMCAFMLINIGNAQELKYGVKGSFLESNLSVQDDGWEALRPGYDVGAYVQYNISDMLGFSFEPSYALKGANEFDPLTIYSQDSPLLSDLSGEPIVYKSQALSLAVVQVPILAQVIMPMGDMNMRIFAGPSIDIITSATHLMVREEPSSADDFINTIESTADVTDQFVYADYTGLVGFGFDIPVDPIELRIDFKYQHGFTNINNVENKPGIYTRTLGVSLGIGF